MKKACRSLESGDLTFVKHAEGLQKIGESVLSSAKRVGSLHRSF